MSISIDPSDILDTIIRLEDEFTVIHNEKIKKSVTDSILARYGDEAKPYLDRYFDEPDINSDSFIDVEDDCPDCSDNAQIVLDRMKIIETIAELLTDENKVQLVNDIITEDTKDKILDVVDHEVRTHLKKIGYYGYTEDVIDSISKLCLTRLIQLM